MMAILVVEDDPDTMAFLHIVLSKAGFDVWEAEDGQQALTMLDSNKAPDLIMLDLLLPHGNGLALCETIRNRKSAAQTPILMISAQGDPGTVRRSLEAGATAYLRKPILPGMLLAKVREILDLDGDSSLAADGRH